MVAVKAGRDAVRHARDGVGVEVEYFLELQLEELPRALAMRSSTA